MGMLLVLENNHDALIAKTVLSLAGQEGLDENKDPYLSGKHIGQIIQGLSR